ncbi:MAG: peroxiredoxin-like family protein [Planctomycetota bacterium]
MRTALPISVAAIAAAGLLTACDQQAEESTGPTTPTQSSSQEAPVSQDAQTTSATTLSVSLEEQKAKSAGYLPDDVKVLYADGIQAVVDSGVVGQAKSVGDEAPGFSLANQSGEDVTLAGLLGEGPVVLLWYRGGWCPYCNLTLKAYQDRLDEINELGATLVAITPEVPDQSLSTAEKNELGFQVLSDPGNAVARAYGVVFELTEGVHANYEQAFGLHAHNGDESGELPLAATYVIDRDGAIRWAFLDADYRNRAEPQDVVDALGSLGG